LEKNIAGQETYTIGMVEDDKVESLLVRLILLSFRVLFTGDSGENYGYEDGWQSDEGVFLYTGQGQIDDMEFKLGNKAIRDHVQDGKQLLLFRALGKGKPVEHLGEFECASLGFGHGPDVNGDSRKTIRFNLEAAFWYFPQSGPGNSESHTKIKSDNERGNYSMMKIDTKTKITLT
jgi:hypothetical protein